MAAAEKGAAMGASQARESVGQLDGCRGGRSVRPSGDRLVWRPVGRSLVGGWLVGWVVGWWVGGLVAGWVAGWVSR